MFYPFDFNQQQMNSALKVFILVEIMTAVDYLYRVVSCTSVYQVVVVVLCIYSSNTPKYLFRFSFSFPMF